MRRSLRSPVLGAALLALSIIAVACGRGPGEDGRAGAGQKGTVTVGAAVFGPEPEIIAEMYAQVLENAGYTVERQFVDTREVLQPAMEQGEIDIAPEYQATLLNFLTGEEPSTDPAENVEPLEQALSERGQTALQYSDAVDTNAFVVTQASADELGLQRVSDLQGVAADLTLGAPPECPHRFYCIDGLREVYGVEFGDFIPIAETPARIETLAAGEIDVALLFSTVPEIAARGFVVLEDDKQLQSADNILPVVGTDVLNQEIERLLDSVSELLTTSIVTDLNSRVSIDGEDPADVARSFLEENGLI
jgi:osmoprotectant transport system substrate-binding protein